MARHPQVDEVARQLMRKYGADAFVVLHKFESASRGVATVALGIGASTDNFDDWYTAASVMVALAVEAEEANPCACEVCATKSRELHKILDMLKATEAGAEAQLGGVH